MMASLSQSVPKPRGARTGESGFLPYGEKRGVMGSKHSGRWLTKVKVNLKGQAPLGINMEGLRIEGGKLILERKGVGEDG